MSDATHIELNDASDLSKGKFRATLAAPDWGIVVLLGPDSPELMELFDLITFHTDPSDNQVFAVWAKDIDAVKDDISNLPSGNSVNFGPSGDRIVGINTSKTVCCTLSAVDAEDLTAVIEVILCACTS